jgi:hypothetical protein
MASAFTPQCQSLIGLYQQVEEQNLLITAEKNATDNRLPVDNNHHWQQTKLLVET